MCSVEDCDRKTVARGLCAKHYYRAQRTGSPTGSTKPSFERRFWSKVDKAGPWSLQRNAPGPCWVWIASLNRAGYGQFGCRRSDDTHTMRHAHSVAYELSVGPVPGGKELDHLCRRRSCVNPAHLEPVTHKVNVNRGEMVPVGFWHAAKTHCPKGHPYDAANTVRTSKQRQCKACRRIWARERYTRKKSAA